MYWECFRASQGGNDKLILWSSWHGMMDLWNCKVSQDWVSWPTNLIQVEQVFWTGKEHSLDNIAENAEFTLPAKLKYHKLKSASTRLYVSTQNKTHDKDSGLLEDYEKLAMHTNAVVIQSYNLKDDSLYQEVFKCYRHWKIVLSKLNKGHYSYSKVSQILNSLSYLSY